MTTTAKQEQLLTLTTTIIVTTATSWSNFNLRAPDAYLALSYLIATVPKSHEQIVV